MEKKIIKSSGISLSNILNHVHFIIYSPFLKLTQKDIYSIYSKSKSFSKALEKAVELLYWYLIAISITFSFFKYSSCPAFDSLLFLIYSEIDTLHITEKIL